MGLLESLLRAGIIDLIAAIDPSSLPPELLPPEYLGYKAEFERVQAEIYRRNADIHLAHAADCESMKALKIKQAQWVADHPDDERAVENEPYMAFIKVEVEAAKAAIEKLGQLHSEFDEFIDSESDRLEALYHVMEDDMRAEQQTPAPADA